MLALLTHQSKYLCPEWKHHLSLEEVHNSAFILKLPLPPITPEEVCEQVKLCFSDSACSCQQPVQISWDQLWGDEEAFL